MGGALTFVAAAAGSVTAIAPFYGKSKPLWKCCNAEMSRKRHLQWYQYGNTLAAAGTPDPQLVDVATIKVPILLQSGSEDGMKGLSDPDTINKTADKIKSARGDVTLHIYEGVTFTGAQTR